MRRNTMSQTSEKGGGRRKCARRALELNIYGEMSPTPFPTTLPVLPLRSIPWPWPSAAMTMPIPLGTSTELQGRSEQTGSYPPPPLSSRLVCLVARLLGLSPVSPGQHEGKFRGYLCKLSKWTRHGEKHATTGGAREDTGPRIEKPTRLLFRLRQTRPLRSSMTRGKKRNRRTGTRKLLRTTYVL